MNSDRRIVCSFSCGATSAVATKLALEKYPFAEVIYMDTGSEHSDNKRFMADCERWFFGDRPRRITVLRSSKYEDIWEVFDKTRWLVGVKGARCTTELKKLPRREFEKPGDLMVLGYDATETKRAEKFRANNPEFGLWCPLIEAGITKEMAIGMLLYAGIELPAMYRLGFRNNNCIGCVKGQAGYWNKIRVEFPKTFERMAKLERKLNTAICKTEAGGVRKKIFLDELDPSAGKYEDLDIKCGLTCGENDGE